jgi:hypothetical protein
MDGHETGKKDLKRTNCYTAGGLSFARRFGK